MFQLFKGARTLTLALTTLVTLAIGGFVNAQTVDHTASSLRHSEMMESDANLPDFEAIMGEAEDYAAFKFGNRVKKKGKKLEAIVDLSSQRMRVLVDGKQIHKWWISSGKLGDETPPGTYRPTRMYRKYRSKQYNGARMPNSVFFHHGYAIHGSFAYHTMGKKASHGCIRLTLAHARKFYNLVLAHGKSNTKIRIQH